MRNVTYDTGDDCMAIKSGRDADGRRIGVPCQNIVIENCASASDPVGTATLSDITVGSSTAANSAVNISHLVVDNVTVGGAPVSA